MIVDIKWSEQGIKFVFLQWTTKSIDSYHRWAPQSVDSKCMDSVDTQYKTIQKKISNL